MTVKFFLWFGSKLTDNALYFRMEFNALRKQFTG